MDRGSPEKGDTNAGRGRGDKIRRKRFEESFSGPGNQGRRRDNLPSRSMDIVIDTVAVKANLKNLQSLDDIPDPTPEQIAKIMKLANCSGDDAIDHYWEAIVSKMHFKEDDVFQKETTSQSASTSALKPGEADRDELLLLQDRIDKLTDEKHESETARDDLSRDLIRSKAEMTSQIEALAAQLQELERDRMDWKSRFEQIEKEIQQVKDATDEKIADMAVALVVTHDFQREETEKKEMVEAELESAKSKLVRLESDLSKQRTENDSLKRSLESERQSHRVELSNAHKHADELSTNVALLKQQLVDSRKTDASVPKIARVQSMLEPGSAEGHRRSAALFGAGVSRRTGSSADESDCIDDSPISGCNVRSMIQTLETTPSSAMTSSGALEASSVTKPSSQTPITPQSSSSTLNDEVPLPGSLKSKKLLGASKHDKRRSSVPTTTVTRLDPIADEPGSPSGGAMGVGGSSGGSTSPGYKLSASVRSKREKFESSDEVLAPPPPVNRPPRSTRNQVSSGGLESSSRAFRSPLNKLKINDIVVTRGSVARDKRAATVVGNNSSPSPAAATNTGSNSSAHNSDNEVAHHVKSGAASGGSTSATGAKTVTQTHVLSGGLGGGGADPIVTIEGGSSGSSDPSLSGAGVGVGVENKALKEIMQKGSHVSVRNAILDWCKQVTAGFPGVEVTNFSSSWNDGLAFCAIFYSHSSPHHLKAFPSFHSLRSQTKKQNFDVATALANVLGIPFNIDVNKIISTDRPEWRVILPVVKAIFEDIALRGDQK